MASRVQEGGAGGPIGSSGKVWAKRAPKVNAKKIDKKAPKLTVKSNVKVVAPTSPLMRKFKNDISTLMNERRSSGASAKTGAKAVENANVTAKAKAEAAQLEKLRVSTARSAAEKARLARKANRGF